MAMRVYMLVLDKLPVAQIEAEPHASSATGCTAVQTSGVYEAMRRHTHLRSGDGGSILEKVQISSRGYATLRRSETRVYTRRS